MSDRQYKRALGIFPSRKDTEFALRELRKSYFPMDNISVIAREKKTSNQEIKIRPKQFGNYVDKGAILSVITNRELSEITVSLAGLGTVKIPEIGPMILAGTAAITIAKTIASKEISEGTSSLVVSLTKLGISEGIAEFYEHRIKQGNYLVIAEGTENKIRLAETILKTCNIKELEISDVDISGRTDTDDKEVNSYIRGVGSFPSQARVESALKKLIDAGFPINQVTLITCDDTEHEWFPNLIVRHHLDNSPLKFPRERRQFFQASLDRGEYLLIVDGAENQFHCAEKILSRCGIHGFYVYDFWHCVSWYHRL
ncbi:MAG: hypothetical protein SWZ49_15255 [Cyanobacteriota bacterium]|nr:hypothetical protein [Cyanobacteriota bacterium]